MPFWRQDTDREKQQKAEQEAAVAALESGQILPRAKQRIEKYLATQRDFFTSDLSALELLLTKEAQIEPISQVLGVSVLSVSMLSLANLGSNYQASQELYEFSGAIKDARRKAFSRMQQEAQLLGASGIVGVKFLSTKRSLTESIKDQIKYTLVGTAVKIPNYPKDLPPFTSTLSGTDLWLLIKAGYRPVSVVSGQSCYYVSPDYYENCMLAYSSLVTRSISNQELHETTGSFMAARERAMASLQEELVGIDADGIVGVDVNYDMEHYEFDGRVRYGNYGYSSAYSTRVTRRITLLLSFNILGTAIASPPPGSKSALSAPSLVLDLTGGKGRGFALNLDNL